MNENTCSWIIQIRLTNGQVIEGIYRGEEDNSFDVVKKLLEGKQENYFVPLLGRDEDSQLFVRAGDISAIEIFEKGDK